MESQKGKPEEKMIVTFVGRCYGSGVSEQEVLRSIFLVDCVRFIGFLVGSEFLQVQTDSEW